MDPTTRCRSLFHLDKVKQASHEKTNTSVSVKIMSKGRIKESYVWKHLYREGQIHGMMDHPNIIKLLHVFENEGGYYMVTELAPGGEVLDYIVAHRHLNEKETRKLIRQLASGVEYMNRMGVVHRDLKAENLLLDANLNLQIIDFGLSNAMEGPAQFLETQCGSPSYSAPELLAGEAYTHDVDVWSMWVPHVLVSCPCVLVDPRRCCDILVDSSMSTPTTRLVFSSTARTCGFYQSHAVV